MPDVRLLKDFKSHKDGEIVRLTDKELDQAYAEGAVRKVYPDPVLPKGEATAPATKK